MTLHEAIVQTQAELQDIFDAQREKLIEDFAHATAEELQAILQRHDAAHQEAQRAARGIVTGAWYTGGGTGGVH